MKYTIAIALFIAPFYMVLSSMPAHAAWTAHKFKDDFTGAVVWNAMGDEVSPESPLDFPYRGTAAHIVIGKQNGELFAAIVFNGSINIVGGSYGVYTGAVAYKVDAIIDGDRETITMYQTNSENDTLRIRYVDWFINKVRNNDTIKIRLQWYGNGGVVFLFHTDGAKKAIGQFID